MSRPLLQPTSILLQPAVMTLWVLIVVLVSCATTSAADDHGTLANARQLLLTGKYGEAAAAYQDLHDEHPVAATIGLANCLGEQGEYAPAIDTLARTAKVHVDSADLLAQQARWQLLLGKYQEADALALKAIEADKTCVLALWIRGELQTRRGDLQAANRQFRALVDHYNAVDKFDSADDIRWIGLAAAQYARWNRLPEQFSFLINELYPAAERIEPNYWPAKLETGKLFLEKYNQAEASAALQAARKANGNSAEVLTAIARMALENFEIDQAQRLASRAKRINKHHVEAWLIEADIQFALVQPHRAVPILRKALPLNPHHEGTLGRLAAAVVLTDGTADLSDHAQSRQIVQQVITFNPQAGEFFAAIGKALLDCRQYPAAATYFQRAHEVLPQMIGPRGQLGLVHMRLGDEQAARKVLEESFEIDPFNVRVRNTLEVLDVLDTYETLETEHFLLRYDLKHDAVLARCAADYLESIYAELTDKLAFNLPEKTLFEFFNDAKNTNGHGWFSARMVGLPQIHPIGACAGKMVALTSPTSMQRQRFHWATVLRHEFVHVINLQQTNFRIPHWFTEALAVRLEDHPRPAQWELLLAQRVPKSDTFNLRNINLGFIRPQTSDDWHMAYCQAELYADFLVERFGEAALAGMLAAYRDGLDTEQAIERVCDIEIDTFEAEYAKYLRQMTEKLIKQGVANEQRSLVELRLAFEQNPNDADTAAELAHLSWRRRQYPQARKLAEAAVKNAPHHQLATLVLAQLKRLVGENDAAEEMLAESLDETSPQPDHLKLLASTYLNSGDVDYAVRLFELGARKFPKDMAWTRSLAAIAIKRKDDEKLAQHLRVLAATEGDNVTYRKKLARLAQQHGDWQAAADWASDVVYIDVMDAAMHQLRAEAHAALNHHAQAADAFRLTTMLLPDKRELWLAYHDQCVAAGMDERARQVAAKWLQYHPDDANAKQRLQGKQP